MTKNMLLFNTQKMLKSLITCKEAGHREIHLFHKNFKPFH